MKTLAARIGGMLVAIALAGGGARAYHFAVAEAGPMVWTRRCTPRRLRDSIRWRAPCSPLPAT
jgi:hypothetical protein